MSPYKHKQQERESRFVKAASNAPRQNGQGSQHEEVRRLPRATTPQTLWTRANGDIPANRRGLAFKQGCLLFHKNATS